MLPGLLPFFSAAHPHQLRKLFMVDVIIEHLLRYCISDIKYRPYTLRRRVQLCHLGRSERNGSSCCSLCCCITWWWNLFRWPEKVLVTSDLGYRVRFEIVGAERIGAEIDFGLPHKVLPLECFIRWFACKCLFLETVEEHAIHPTSLVLLATKNGANQIICSSSRVAYRSWVRHLKPTVGDLN